MRFRSFRGRLVAVFVGLFAVILAACFLVVALSVRASARHEINQELRLAATLFMRQLESRSQQLAAATRLLSGDFALKTTAATADHATTRSVLENHRQRIGADVLMLVTPEGTIAVDTRNPSRQRMAFPLPHLLEQADQSGEASRIAAPFDISLQAVSRHVQVLVHAGLVQQERTGRVARCSLEIGSMFAAAVWINEYSQYWQEQFDTLARWLKTLERGRTRTRRRARSTRRKSSARRT